MKCVGSREAKPSIFFVSTLRSKGGGRPFHEGRSQGSVSKVSRCAIGRTRPQIGVFGLAVAAIELSRRCFNGKQATSFPRKCSRECASLNDQRVDGRTERFPGSPDIKKPDTMGAGLFHTGRSSRPAMITCGDDVQRRYRTGPGPARPTMLAPARRSRLRCPARRQASWSGCWRCPRSAGWSWCRQHES